MVEIYIKANEKTSPASPLQETGNKLPLIYMEKRGTKNINYYDVHCPEPRLQERAV